jgi:hypothetical protein
VIFWGFGWWFGPLVWNYGDSPMKGVATIATTGHPHNSKPHIWLSVQHWKIYSGFNQPNSCFGGKKHGDIANHTWI